MSCTKCGMLKALFLGNNEFHNEKSHFLFADL